MAVVGQTVSILNNSHIQVFVPSGAQYPSVAILNPNDGVVYVAQDRDVTGTSVAQWDYKVPSQSYAQLPGPFMSVGMFYQDQSGAGTPGAVTIYPIPIAIPFPDFHAIGRALSTLGSALDISEGAQPANPGSGILRIWADGTDRLHLLNPTGADSTVLDSRHAINVAPNNITGKTVTASGGDLIADRLDGSGLVAFNTAETHYLFWNGSQFVFTDAVNFNGIAPTGIPAGSLAGSLITTSTITRSQLAADAKTSVFGNYIAATTFSSSVAASWVNTPMSIGPLSFPGGVNYLLLATASIFNVSSTDITEIGWGLDGSIQASLNLISNHTNSVRFPASFATIIAPSAGSHTISMMMFQTTGTMGIDNNIASELLLIQLTQ